MARPSLSQVVADVRRRPGRERRRPPRFNPAGTTAVIRVLPNSSPQAQGTSDLVSRLRSDVIPPAVANSDVKVYVGGSTAAFIDISDRIASRLPWFIGSVIALSFLLLMVVFRSILVPLKAAIMNVLSIGAAYGVIVAVFQWGWFRELFGVEQSLPIVSFIPMMMFAILFGLSMDYEVFLLSRVREEYLRTGDARSSVPAGLAADRARHHVGRAHHDLRVPQLRARGRADREDDGPRSRDRGVRRRHDHPHGARARDDGAARRRELVAAQVARPAPPAPRPRRCTGNRSAADAGPEPELVGASR